GLAVTAATIYMAIMGGEGLKQVALASHENTQKLLKLLTEIPGVKARFPQTPYFHEVVLQLPEKAKKVCEALVKQGIIAGYDLSQDFSGMDNCIVLCATETKI